MNPIYAHLTYFMKIHFNIMLSSMRRSSSSLFPSDFSIKTLYAFQFSSWHTTCPTREYDIIVLVFLLLEEMDESFDVLQTLFTWW
jgi:hypothetical protein